MLLGQPLDGILCQTSPAGDILAIACADGRIKTYDTVTGKYRCQLSSSKGNKETGHLSEKHTALAIAPVGKAGGVAAGSHVVAVASASGTLTAYDASTGDMRWQTADCNEGGVASVSYSTGAAAAFYTAGADGYINKLDPHSGQISSRFRAGKHGLTGLAVDAAGQRALAGSSGLALWDLQAQERLCKFTGHPMPVRCAAFVPGSSYALSAAAGERHVAVWRTAKPFSSKKTNVAAASVSMEDPAVSLHAFAAAGQEQHFFAAAVTEAGEAYVWKFVAQPEGQLQAQPLAHVRVAGSGSKGETAGRREVVLAAHLEPGSKQGPALLVARGSTAKPIFERVQISSSAAQQQLILLQPAAGGALLGSTHADGAAAAAAAAAAVAAAAAAGKRSKNDITVLGHDDAGEAVLLRTGAQAAAAGKKRSKPEQESAIDGTAAAAAAGAELAQQQQQSQQEDDEPAFEETLGQRVAALERAAAGDMDTALQQGGGGAAGAGPSSAAAAAPPGPIKADSLGVLLTQALRSGDRALLERCVAVSDARVVNNTVRRLLPADAAAFLRAAVERLQSKPGRGQQLSAWIRAVLVHHAAYLMASPGVQGVLTSLYQTIEARLALQRTLLSLSGRLDLLTTQARARGGAAGVADELDDSGEGPQVVYQESEDEEVEVEDPFAAGADSDDDGDGDAVSGDDLGEDEDLSSDEGDDDDDDLVGADSDEDL